MENKRDQLVVIMAGYKDRMDEFFKCNPGMSSRIAHHVNFAPYEPDELVAIGRGMLDHASYYLSDEAEAAFKAAVTPEERQRFPPWSGCIACGLCNVGEGERIARSGGRYGGVMDLMLASSRSMPDFDAAARSLASVSDSRLAELEARCPARVPMREVAAFVRAKAAALTDPPAPSDPAP